MTTPKWHFRVYGRKRRSPSLSQPPNHFWHFSYTPLSLGQKRECRNDLHCSLVRRISLGRRGSGSYIFFSAECESFCAKQVLLSFPFSRFAPLHCTEKRSKQLCSWSLRRVSRSIGFSIDWRSPQNRTCIAGYILSLSAVWQTERGRRTFDCLMTVQGWDSHGPYRSEQQPKWKVRKSRYYGI